MASWLEGHRGELVAFFGAGANAALQCLGDAAATWGEPVNFDLAGADSVAFTFETPDGLRLTARLPPQYPTVSLSFVVSLRGDAVKDGNEATGMGGMLESWPVDAGWWDLEKLTAELEDIAATFEGQDQLLPLLNACHMAGCRANSIVYDVEPADKPKPAAPPTPLHNAPAPPADAADTSVPRIAAEESGAADVEKQLPKVYDMAYHTWAAVCLFLGPKGLAAVMRVNRFLYDVATDEAVWEHGWRINAPVNSRKARDMPAFASLFSFHEEQVDLFDTSHKDHVSWGSGGGCSAGSRRARVKDEDPWKFSPMPNKRRGPGAGALDPPELPWSHRWSYVARAAAAGVVAPTARYGTDCYKSQAAAYELAEERYRTALALGWKWLFVHTSNPFARAWARLMANYESGNANIALAIFYKFPFHRLRKKLAVLVGIPITDEARLRLRGAISDRSLDHDEANEFDVTKRATVVFKRRDVHYPAPPRGAADAETDELGLPLDQTTATAAAAATGGEMEAAWQAANDAPVLLVRRSTDPRMVTAVRVQVSERAAAIASANQRQAPASA